MRRTSWRVRLIAASLGIFATATYAQTPSALPEWVYSTGSQLRSYYLWPNLPKWEINGGFADSFSNKYPGSNEYYDTVGPNFDFMYKDIAFFATGEGLGINILRGQNYRVGTALTYDLGRPDKRSGELSGMGNIRWAPESKVFAEYVLFPLTFRVDARKAYGGYNGAIADISVYTPVAGSHTFFIFVGPSVTFADQNYTKSYFGVTPAQSTASGYPVYSPGGGLQKASFGINATFFVHGQWYVNVTGAGARLFNDAVDSPLNDKRLDASASFTVGYDWRSKIPK